MFPRPISSLAEAFNNLKIYDVYLCFYEADINCQWFASNLCRALLKESIFMRVSREEAGCAYESIRRSRICIPLFSKTFVHSQSFLDEVYFMFKSNAKVVPLFYDIVPSEVRHQDILQSPPYLEIFKAIEKVSWTNGWSADQYKVLPTEDIGSHFMFRESDLIGDVVRDVRKTLEENKFNLDTPKCFGLEWRVEHVRRLLNLADSHEKKVVKVGIYGIVGMGKTTLAKVVCKSVSYSQFEVHCFVLGVGERCEQENGLVKLQRHMLKEVSSPKDGADHDDVDEGKEMLRGSVRGKRLLLLLDDIHTADQLEALLGNFTDFGAGTRLLITSQNQHILKLANVDEMVEVGRLSEEDAMDLFNSHAFPNSQVCPDPEIERVSKNVVNACEGHPLALQLVGKNLVGEDDIDVWKDMGEKVRDDPYMQKKLRASYDTLDDHEKEMFQDIACFLTGHDKHISVIFWADLKWNCHASLARLFQKSFVKVGPANDFLMHRCLRDWGTTVANEISREPHKRTRLFDEEDVHHVLHRPSEKVKTVRYLRYEPKERKTMKADMLRQMYNLRLLWLANVEIKGGFPEECYFDELRWIRMRRCSLTYLPQGMKVKKLLILEVTDSHITRLWDDNPEEYPNEWPEKLKVLILRGCEFLENIPDRIMYTQLKILDLHNCHSFKSLPNSMGKFQSLVSLNMKGCAVSRLPDDFGELSSLEELDLSWCKNLAKLPDSLGKLSNLERLEIHHNPKMRELPESIGGLRRIEYLDAGYCQLCENGLPAGTFELCSLRIINLEHNMFRRLPGGFQKMSGLWELHLDDCKHLSELTALPPSLEILFARHCIRLQKLCCLSGLINLCILDVSRSSHLTGLPGLDSLPRLTTLKLVGCTMLSTATLGSCVAGLNSLESLFIAGPAITANQLLSFYDTIKAVSLKSQCVLSGRGHGYKWLQAEPNGQNSPEDNCFDLCDAFENEKKYCAGYIVCCVSVGEAEGDGEGEGLKKRRLRYSIERNEDVRGCEMIHPEMEMERDGGSEYVLEMRVVRVDGDNDFNWLRMGDKMRVSAGSDHQTWKACFKFLMYDPIHVIYPRVEEKPPRTITFVV